MDTINSLFEVITKRREHPAQGSYTCYLFNEGEDKILKKVGEECAETIIAAKNGGGDALVGELCDLAYHLLVLMAYKGISPDAVKAELKRRSQKIGNLKERKQTDKNT